MDCIVNTSTVAVLAIATTALGVAAVSGLIAFLIAKELSAATTGSWPHLFSRHLNMAVVPLLVVFAFIVIVRIVGVLP